MALGETLKFLRASSGMKQSELARRVGVSPNYISMVETNRRVPSIELAKAIADEFGVPLGLLFLEVGPTEHQQSPEKSALLLRLRDLIFEIERIRIQEEAIASSED